MFVTFLEDWGDIRFLPVMAHWFFFDRNNFTMSGRYMLHECYDLDFRAEVNNNLANMGKLPTGWIY